MSLTRNALFSRVTVDHATKGSSRISWELRPEIVVPIGAEFQLEASDVGHDSADDWEAIGPPVTDACEAYDDTVIYAGSVQNRHYRVVLIHEGRRWASPAAHTYGVLRKRDWNLVRAMIRKRTLVEESFTACEGWLLRRLWKGELPEPESFEIDFLTGEPLTSKGSTHGTEFVGGYYAPLPFRVDMSQETRHLVRNDQNFGTAGPQKIRGFCVAFPQLNTNDVWVHASSDVRYEISVVGHGAELRGVPVIASVELSPLARGDAAYDVQVPDRHPGTAK